MRSHTGPRCKLVQLQVSAQGWRALDSSAVGAQCWPRARAARGCLGGLGLLRGAPGSGLVPQPLLEFFGPSQSSTHVLLPSFRLSGTFRALLLPPLLLRACPPRADSVPVLPHLAVAADVHRSRIGNSALLWQITTHPNQQRVPLPGSGARSPRSRCGQGWPPEAVRGVCPRPLLALWPEVFGAPWLVEVLPRPRPHVVWPALALCVWVGQGPPG